MELDTQFESLLESASILETIELVKHEVEMSSGDLLTKPTAIVWPTILEEQDTTQDIFISSSKGTEEKLLRAAYENDSIAAEELLSSGTDPNCWDINGLTPIHVAAARGHVLLVGMLRGRGALVNSRAFGGFTPLHMAAFSGSANCASLLLEGSADPSLEDMYGLTPLKVAVQLEHHEVAALLRLRGGVD